MKFRTLALAASLALAAAGAAFAQDGTADLLINPATGATITTSGSYRLVSDVTMTADVEAISISNAFNVTLDLGGHKITAADESTKAGITSLIAFDITVMNGSVTGFGAEGIKVDGDRSVVRNVRVTACASTGNRVALSVGSEAVVEGCTVNNNDAGSGWVVGILGGDRSRIAGNLVSGCQAGGGFFVGIQAGNDGLIADNTVSGNDGSTSGDCYGVFVSSSCVIRRNTVTDNDNSGVGSAIGIQTGAGCMIERNVCSRQTGGSSGSTSGYGIVSTQSTIVGNDCSANSVSGGSNGTGVGISGDFRCLIQDNRCELNNGTGGGFSTGIRANTQCRVEGNHCALNTGGAASHGIRVLGSGNLISGNSTAGHTNAGIIFLNSASNRCELNRCDESEVVESTAPGLAPSSVGAGDLANILF